MMRVAEKEDSQHVSSAYVIGNPPHGQRKQPKGDKCAGR
jgi:hypothetical protein